MDERQRVETVYDGWFPKVAPIVDETKELPRFSNEEVRTAMLPLPQMKKKHPLDNEANFNEWLRTDQSYSYQTWLDRQMKIAETQRIPRVEPLRNDPQNFQDLAKSRVREVIDAQFADIDEHPEYDLYIVWFCKTLQNWKALICTSLEDNMYYEVTYNGAKFETYVDQYKKVMNSVIYDEKG